MQTETATRRKEVQNVARGSPGASCVRAMRIGHRCTRQRRRRGQGRGDVRGCPLNRKRKTHRSRRRNSGGSLRRCCDTSLPWHGDARIVHKGQTELRSEPDRVERLDRGARHPRTDGTTHRQVLQEGVRRKRRRSPALVLAPLEEDQKSACVGLPRATWDHAAIGVASLEHEVPRS